MALLASQQVGRLAVALPTDGPLVVPVNYALDGEHIVFRTGHGTKLRALNSRLVSFQVDQIDTQRHTGWSVLVRGRAREVSGREHAHVDVEPWVPEGKRHWVRLQIRSITGRRLEHHTDWESEQDAYL